jgi:hypothetical protein
VSVRHLVAEANVGRNGLVLDPRQVRHGTVRAGRVWALAGEVDPQTHLNLDFAGHRLESCVVVATLAGGAAVRVVDDGYRLATVAADAFHHLGAVDVGQRRAAWLAQFQARRRTGCAEPAPAVRSTPARYGKRDRGEAGP